MTAGTAKANWAARSHPDPATRSGTPAGRGASRDERLAVIVFAVLVAAAVPLYLWLGNQQWFYLDEWDFLADRDVRSLDDLLRPHNEHWSTLPIIVYRFLFRFFGLRTYVPYQLCVILLHATAAVLLRVIMRRAGVGPWLATAAAIAFLLLGEGRSNIVWAFQIGFTGSVAAGLGHLVLADHDGPVNGRDAAGLAVGVAGLLCSTIAVPMTAAVGLTLLVRRGWRVAALHTGPLALLYGAWYLAYGRENRGSLDLDPAAMFDFTVTGVTNMFASLGQVPAVAVALGIVGVVGLTLGLRWPTEGGGRRRFAAPLALLTAMLVFFLVAGAGRAAMLGADSAKADRYVHIGVALAIPALALAADGIARRWPLLLVPLGVMLLAGVPGNLREVRLTGAERVAAGARLPVETMAHLPALERVPRSARPSPSIHFTVGWLRDMAKAGSIPEPERMDPQLVARANLRILFDRYGLASDRLSPLRRQEPRLTPCSTIAAMRPQAIRAGQAIVTAGGGAQLRFVDGGVLNPAIWQQVPTDSTLVARDAVVVEVKSSTPGATVEVCG